MGVYVRGRVSDGRVSLRRVPPACISWAGQGKAGRSSRTSYASMRHLRQAEMYKDKNGKPRGGGSIIVRGLEKPRRAYGMISRCCEWGYWCSLLRAANRDA